MSKNPYQKHVIRFTHFLSLILIPFSSFTLCAQEETPLIDRVNEAVKKLEYLHFKTRNYSKYYTTDDTTRYEAETWIYKTEDDTVLGMHIRSIGQYDYGHIESFHKGTNTWLINHDTDTITKYDQTKDQWDGFTGNVITNWTTEIPLITGIEFGPEDSIDITNLDNGDWIIHRVAPDLAQYSIADIEDWLYIDRHTFLPYRAEMSWILEGRQTYSDLHIELLDTASPPIVEGLYKDFPDYPIVEYSPPNPDLFQPLEIGKKAPSLEGHFVESANSFELAKHLEGNLVMIDFWYQSCAPCIRAIPYLDSLVREYEDRGFLLFGVNSRDHNTPTDELLDFVEKRGGNKETIVLTDLETEQKKWKCYANPTFYLIKDGSIVWVQQGFGPELMSEFRAQVEKYLE